MKPRLIAACALAAALTSFGPRAFANEVIRSRLVGDPRVGCSEWLTARQTNSARLPELKAWVQGYAEGVRNHVHFEAKPDRPRFSFDDLYTGIDAYCRTHDDELSAVTEIVLDKFWPEADTGEYD